MFHETWDILADRDRATAEALSGFADANGVALRRSNGQRTPKRYGSQRPRAG